MRSGGCQCGAVRYRISGPLGRAYACHCRDCQKQSASAFSVSVPVARAALHIEGETAVFEKTAESGALTTCAFCPRCGTGLFHASSRAAEIVTLKVGTLDDVADIAPASHLWVSRKQPWVRLDPQTPAFEQQPLDLAAWRRGLLAL